VAAEAARRGHALQVIHVPAGMQVLAQVCEVDRLLG
jgi:phospholipid transport system transporter-binding protein